MKIKNIFNKGFLFVAVSCFLFSLSYAQAVTTIDPNNMDPSTDAGKADLARFLYMLVNGPIVSGGTVVYTLQDGPNFNRTNVSNDKKGLVGLIREILGASSLGGALHRAGYDSCSDIPTTGSITDSGSGTGGATYKMTFSTGSVQIPTGFTAAGSTFQKRITITRNNVSFMNVEITCESSGVPRTGWIRADMSEGSNPARKFETFFEKADNSDAIRLNFYMAYTDSSSNQENFIMRFVTTDGNTFSLYMIRTYVPASGSASYFNVGLQGTKSTHKVNMYMSAPSASSDTTVISTVTPVCMDLSSNTASSGCSSLSAPSSVVFSSGTSSAWTVQTVSGLTLPSL